MKNLAPKRSLRIVKADCLCVHPIQCYSSYCSRPPPPLHKSVSARKPQLLLQAVSWRPPQCQMPCPSNTLNNFVSVERLTKVVITLTKLVITNCSNRKWMSGS